MTLPTPFTTASPILASYDYVDVANGLGIQLFYFAYVRDTASLRWIMTDKAMRSAGGAAAARINSNNDIKMDLTPFNTSRTVKGTATLSGSLLHGAAGYMHATLYHWNGTTETAISSTISSGNELNTSGDIPFIIELPLTETLFKRGDILRIGVGCNVANNVRINIEATSSEALKLYMPFKLDL